MTTFTPATHLPTVLSLVNNLLASVAPTPVIPVPRQLELFETAAIAGGVNDLPAQIPVGVHHVDITTQTTGTVKKFGGYTQVQTTAMNPLHVLGLALDRMPARTRSKFVNEVLAELHTHGKPIGIPIGSEGRTALAMLKGACVRDHSGKTHKYTTTRFKGV